MNYRFYLLDGEDRFRAAESFTASGDAEAKQIADDVYAACSDTFDGFELWRGTERIAKGRELDGRAEITLQAIVEQREKDALDLEERLQRSFECVRSSRKLIEEALRLRGALAGSC